MIIMALSDSSMKAKFQKRIYDGLKKEFGPSAAKGDGYSATADEFWLKLSNALAEIAVDLVEEITTKATVMPGQQVATTGSPAAQTGSTVSPGRIS